jgi:hypothetical protein
MEHRQTVQRCLAGMFTVLKNLSNLMTIAGEDFTTSAQKKSFFNFSQLAGASGASLWATPSASSFCHSPETLPAWQTHCLLCCRIASHQTLRPCKPSMHSHTM